MSITNKKKDEVQLDIAYVYPRKCLRMEGAEEELRTVHQTAESGRAGVALIRLR